MGILRWLVKELISLKPVLCSNISILSIYSKKLMMIGMVSWILCIYPLCAVIVTGCCTVQVRSSPDILPPLQPAREPKEVDDPWFEPEMGECGDEVPAVRNNQNWTCNTDCDCNNCDSPFCNKYGWCDDNTMDGRRLIR